MNHRQTLTAALLLALLPFAVGCGGDDDDDAPKAEAWVGKTYELVAPASHWAQPRGAGDEFAPYAPRFLLSIQAATAETVDVLLGAADETDTQELCNPTLNVQATVSEYPSFQLGPIDAPVYLEQVTETETVRKVITAYSLRITNVLPDGDVLAEEGELTAFLDLREMYPLLTLLGDQRNEDTVCAGLYEHLNVQCEACPQDSAAYCLAIQAVRLGATEFAGAVQSVAAGDPACDEWTR